MANILKMQVAGLDRTAATTAPQDVLREDAATFDVLRRSFYLLTNRATNNLSRHEIVWVAPSILERQL